MNRLEVASDGKTTYERMKDKRADVVGLDFGNTVLWTHLPRSKMQRLKARQGYWLFFGARARGGGILAVDGESKQLKS
jgi:hypothetical protein